MKIIEGYTFDDVLLVPQKSSIRSRKDIDISTTLVSGITLQIPIISANMDTVTESDMAIALAREGGLGIIHRFIDIEKQAEEVRKVKRAQSYMIDDPITLSPNHTIRDAKLAFSAHSISGVIIIDEERVVCGIVTKRDIVFENNLNKPLKDVMTKEVITAKYGLLLERAEEYFKKYRFEKLPLVDSKGKLRGLITLRDIVKIEQFPKASKDKSGKLLVGAAVGVKDEDMERALALVGTGVDILVVDIAHGHSDHTVSMVKRLRKKFSQIPIVAGNVATSEGVADLAKAGADVIKVGVGPGTTCITRIVTGSGYPQLSAILDCAAEAKKQKVGIIADGGIRNSGDLTKALAAGANTAMLGGFFSGTEEAPGVIVIRNGKKYKMMRGMASLTANITRKGSTTDVSQDSVDDVTPEGVEALVPYKGNVSEILRGLIGGLRSGLSYSGAKTIRELWKKAKFVKISSAGLTESRPHDLEEIR